MKTRGMGESLKGFIKNLKLNVLSLELTHWILPYLWITAHVLTKLFFHILILKIKMFGGENMLCIFLHLESDALIFAI